MQVCRRRSLNRSNDDNGNYSGRETDSQESSNSNSDEDLFDSKFFNSGKNLYNKNQMGSRGRYHYLGSSKNMTHQSLNRSHSSNNMNNYKSSYGYNGQINFNRRNIISSRFDSRGSNDNNYLNRYNNNNNNMNRNNDYNNNNSNNNNNNNNRDDSHKYDKDQAVSHSFFIYTKYFKDLLLVSK
jgi:hypothetical protein